MLDFGFTPTLARNVSYVLGGAKKLHKSGLEVAEGTGEVDYGLLGAVIGASRRIFAFITAIALVVIGTVGTWFFLHVTRGQLPLSTVLTTWAIFVASIGINLYFRYFTPLLQGRGLFAEFYRVTALSSVCFVVAVAIFLFLGFGLVGVATSYLIAALVGRVLSANYFYDKEFVRQMRLVKEPEVSVTEVVATLWRNAWRSGLVAVGSFLITKANTLVASVYLGLAVTSRYGLTIQIFAVLSGMSNVIMTIQMQKMARYRVGGAERELRRLVAQTLAASAAIYIAGAIIVILFGQALVANLGSHTQMLDRPLVIAIAVMLLLEFNHSVAAGIIVTRNHVPFVRPALVSGISVLLLSVIGLRFGGFGIGWLIFAQFVTQLSYNNWKWPVEMARDFRTNYFSLMGSGVVLIAARMRRWRRAHA